jgi:xanthine dehydrogenase small subunit
VRAADELVIAVRIPLPLATTTSFQKVAKRRYDDISSVAVALALDVENGVVRRARVGLGGVAAVPLRARATEDALTGRPWDRETVEHAARLLAAEGSPIDDHRASAAYRAAMLGQALRRLHVQTTTEAVHR